MTLCDTTEQNPASPSRAVRRAALSRASAVVPAGFPRPQCMNGSKLFKALYGDPPRSTWAKWKKDGVIPAPDKQIGKLSFWWEETMWKSLAGDEQAVLK